MILIAELFTKKNSGEIARKRLKHLLTADRAGCSPELLDLIRADFLPKKRLERLQNFE